MVFHPGLSLVTLGVADVARATRFYEALGWRRSEAASNADISFFALNNTAFALFGRKALAEDSGLPGNEAAPAFSGVTLANNQPSEAAVEAVIADVRALGARILVEPGATDWGGYHGVFADPDGHIWEVAYNPFFPLAPDGSIALPP